MPGWLALRLNWRGRDVIDADHHWNCCRSLAHGQNLEGYLRADERIRARRNQDTQRPEKGDIRLLRKTDGTLYPSIDFPTVEKYAGISARRRQQLMTDESLKVIGQRLNRRITVESLLAYCPPEEDAK